MAFCLYCDEPFVPRQGGCDHHCLDCCDCCAYEPVYDHDDAADERYQIDRDADKQQAPVRRGEDVASQEGGTN